MEVGVYEQLLKPALLREQHHKGYDIVRGQSQPDLRSVDVLVNEPVTPRLPAARMPARGEGGVPRVEPALDDGVKVGRFEGAKDEGQGLIIISAIRWIAPVLGVLAGLNPLPERAGFAKLVLWPRDL